MKRSKFSEAQIAFVLKQAEDGTAIGEVCRKGGMLVHLGINLIGNTALEAESE